MTTKSPIRNLILLLSAIAVVLAGCGGDVDDGASQPTAEDPATEVQGTPAETESVTESVQLDFASFVGEGLSIGEASVWLMEQIEAEVPSVTFERHMEGSLLGADEIMEGIGDGRVAVGHWSTVYHTGEFPLSEVIGIPLLTSNLPAQTAALNEMYHASEDMQEEYESQGLRLITFLGGTPSVLGTNVPVETLDDIAGLSIRSSGLINQALEAIGANPVVIPSPETYEAMQRGVIDGFAGIVLDFVVGLSLQEVATHITDTGLGNFAGTVITVNLDEWNRLSPEAQDEIDRIIREEFPGQLAEIQTRHEEQACDALIEHGNELSALSQSEIDRWVETLGDTVLEGWRSDVEAAGADADEFYNEYVDLLRSYEQEWSDYTPGMPRCIERASG